MSTPPPIALAKTSRGGIARLLLIALGLSALLTFGIPLIREVLRIKNAELCRANLIEIQKGKASYIAAHSFTRPGVLPENPDRYISLIPYMPLKNIPECPCGLPYLHVLDLAKPAQCQVNGNPEFEPLTPNVPLKSNGYHDTAPITVKATPWHALKEPFNWLQQSPTPNAKNQK